MRSASTSYRLALVVAAGTVLLLVAGMGALGIVGAGGRADMMYVAVLAVGAVGTVTARLRPYGMALVLVAMALTQALVTVVALITVAAGWQPTEGASVIDIVGINALYIAGFSLSAWLFRRGAAQPLATVLPDRA